MHQELLFLYVVDTLYILVCGIESMETRAVAAMVLCILGLKGLQKILGG